MSKIIVVGSSNTDMVIKSKRLPVPGETILGGTFLMNAGGKGANQAVAAARLGGKVIFVAKTGNDLFGNEAIQLFKKEGIDVSFAVKDNENPSGVALINVDEKGENCIVVAPGSNGSLSANDLAADLFETEKADLFLLQLEIPLETVAFVSKKAFSGGHKVILNPAPACILQNDLLSSIYLITPNETEAEILTGIKVHDIASAENAAKKIQSKGVKNVIITMGAMGSFVLSGSTSKMIPVKPVKAIDTTAAGDIFNGALAVAISEGKGLEEAAVFANKAASLSVTRMGAQASAPYRKELV
jgi:ribokinase